MKSEHALCAPSWYSRGWVCKIQGWLSQLLRVGVCSPLITYFSVAVKMGQADLWGERFLLGLFRHECYITNCLHGAELQNSSTGVVFIFTSLWFVAVCVLITPTFCPWTETTRYLASQVAMQINKWSQFFSFKPRPFFLPLSDLDVALQLPFPRSGDARWKLQRDKRIVSCLEMMVLKPSCYSWEKEDVTPSIFISVASSLIGVQNWFFFS